MSWEGQGGAGRRWCVPSAGCAQCPDGFAGSVVLQLQHRTCPSTHRAGTSVAAGFWAQAVKKQWLFLTLLLHCLGSSGAVGSVWWHPAAAFLGAGLEVRIYIVPSSRRKGAKRFKTVKLRKQRLLILQLCKNPFCSQSPAKEGDY